MELFNGKAKKLFDNWFDENYEAISLRIIDDEVYLDGFYELPLSMQWGVIEDFARSLGYEITKTVYKNRIDYTIHRFDYYGFVTISEFTSLERGRMQLIEELNNLLNK